MTPLRCEMVLSSITGMLHCTAGRAVLGLCVSRQLAPWLSSLRSSTSKVDQVSPGKENEVLVENLTVLGVDIKMARRRQPGVLRKVITNEQGLARFLQAKGASREVVASIISRYPRAITRSHQHLEERWRLWRNVFKRDDEIVKIVERSPESFFRSSDNANLEKNIAFLWSLGLTSKDLHRLLTTAPRTFSNSAELNRQMVELLQDICVSLGGTDPEQFIKRIISRNVYILIRSTKRVKTNVEFLQGALRLSNAELLRLLQGHGADILDLSSEYIKRNFRRAEQKLRSLGCCQEKVKNFIILYPPALYISPENLKNKIDCLLEGGVDIEQILEKPRVLDFSTETVRSRLRELEKAGYDFKKQGISILDYSRKRFEAKLGKLSEQPEE
ncbi:MTEF1 factor, partial [Atractosteus spatula]|nr:MTEF1 factor [Atractosteus spatula]